MYNSAWFPSFAIGILQDISNLSQNYWAQIIGVAILAFIAGLMFDRMTEKKSAKRKMRLITLGLSASNIGDGLTRIRYRSAEYTVAQYRPDVASLFISINKEGFDTPKFRDSLKDDEILNIWIAYLQAIGKLLSDEHFDEAREIAATLSKELNETY